jgi:hypothetical protein
MDAFLLPSIVNAVVLLAACYFSSRCAVGYAMRAIIVR